MARIIRETKSGYVVTSEDHQKIYKILEKEIEIKLLGKKNDDFKFIDVELFEEKYVMSKMINIIEKNIEKR